MKKTLSLIILIIPFSLLSAQSAGLPVKDSVSRKDSVSPAVKQLPVATDWRNRYLPQAPSYRPEWRKDEYRSGRFNDYQPPRQVAASVIGNILISILAAKTNHSTRP